MWTARPGDERGVIAPLTAVLMTAMLGMAALVIDTGMLYSEKAQLQNAADAGALAIALACAADPGSPTCQQQKAAASTITDGNVLDGRAGLFTPTLNEKDGTVDVTVETMDAAGKKGFPLVFGRVLGIEEAYTQASAQARWDGYKSAHVLPIAFSKCEAEAGWTKPLQFLALHGSAAPCMPKNGLEVPGGFGWLQDPLQDGKCSLPVSVETSATPSYQSDTGANVPADCNAKFTEFENDLNAGKTVEILVPIFYKTTGTGNSAWFHIEAFAQISLRGWHFGANGRHYLTPDAQAMYSTIKPSDTGLFGKYIRKVTTAEAAVLGGPATYAALGVRLSK